jgi:hypothetical protein
MLGDMGIKLSLSSVLCVGNFECKSFKYNSMIIETFNLKVNYRLLHMFKTDFTFKSTVLMRQASVYFVFYCRSPWHPK